MTSDTVIICHFVHVFIIYKPVLILNNNIKDRFSMRSGLGNKMATFKK